MCILYSLVVSLEKNRVLFPQQPLIAGSALVIAKEWAFFQEMHKVDLMDVSLQNPVSGYNWAYLPRSVQAGWQQDPPRQHEG